MREIIGLILYLLAAQMIIAQPELRKNLTLPQYQIFLKQPVQKITSVTFNDSAMTPLKFRLEKNRQQIILEGYQRGRTLTIHTINEYGEPEEIFQTPCYIDPIPPS
ncbi:MAG: hypothetical protein AAF655_14485 [Bacteroidota bacterium]